MINQRKRIIAPLYVMSDIGHSATDNKYRFKKRRLRWGVGRMQRLHWRDSIPEA